MLRKSICIPWSFNTFLICAGKMSCKNDLSNWSWFLNTHVRPGLLIIFQFLFVSTNQKKLVFCCTKKDTNDKICMRACPDHSTTKQVNLKTQHSHLHFTFSTIFQENHTGWFLISDGSLFCSDARDISTKCYVTINSRFQGQVFHLIHIQVRAGCDPWFKKYSIVFSLHYC